jgi:hypothetical protein
VDDSNPAFRGGGWQRGLPVALAAAAVGLLAGRAIFELFVSYGGCELRHPDFSGVLTRMLATVGLVLADMGGFALRGRMGGWPTATCGAAVMAAVELFGPSRDGYPSHWRQPTARSLWTPASIRAYITGPSTTSLPVCAAARA